MNLHELNRLIDACINDVELHNFYCKKRDELIERIKLGVEKRTGYKRINRLELQKIFNKVLQINLADKMFVYNNN